MNRYLKQSIFIYIFSTQINTFKNIYLQLHINDNVYPFKPFLLIREIK